jgi:predicted alpha/beta-hydrolase family hydrolase
LFVSSDGGDSSFTVSSKGATSDAVLAIEVKEDNAAKLVMTEGDTTFELKNDGVLDQFAITDGTHNLMAIKASTGAATIHGDLTVGGAASTGNRTASVLSTNGAASLAVEAGGLTGDALISVAAPTGQMSKVVLTETGGSSFSLMNDGSKDRLVVRDSSHELWSVAPLTGQTSVRGNIVIGGQSVGPRSASIRAVNGSAHLKVSADDGAAQMLIQAGGHNNGNVAVDVTSGQNALLELKQGSRFFSLVNVGAQDHLAVRTDAGLDLLTMARSTGAATFRGDVTFGGSGAAPGPRAVTVKSNIGKAEFAIQAGGSSNALMRIIAPENNDAKIELWEGSPKNNGKVFSIFNDGTADRLVISDGTYDLLTMARTTGEITNRGDMTIGGEGSTGPKVFTVKSMDAAASIAVESGGAANALLAIRAPSGQDAKVTMTEGTNTFNIFNDGSEDKLTIDDNTHTLLTLERGTGDTTIRGDITVGQRNGTRAATIISQQSSSTLAVIAGGGAAITHMQAPSGQNALLRLTQGQHSFNIANNATLDQLVVDDGVTQLVSVARGSGAVGLHGDVTVGDSLGSRFATIRSLDNATTLAVEAGGTGAAEVAIRAAMDQRALLSLSEGSQKFVVMNDGAKDQLGIDDENYRLLSIARGSGDMATRGDLTVGLAPGPRSMSVRSYDTAASMVIKSGGSGRSTLHLIAPDGADSQVVWSTGNYTMEMKHRSSTDELVFTDGVNDLLALGRTTGSQVIRGDLLVGGNEDARKATIVSKSSSATIEVASGGNSSATVAIKAPSGADSRITLAEVGGETFTIMNDGSHNRLAIREGGQDLVTVAASADGSGVMTRGDLTVGGHGMQGARAATVYANNGTASLTVQADSAHAAIHVQSAATQDAVATLTSGVGKQARVELAEGGNAFHVGNDGSGHLVVEDGNTLFRLARTSGNALLRGNLTVGGTTPGARSATIMSSDNSASLHIKSGGSGRADIM